MKPPKFFLVLVVSTIQACGHLAAVDFMPNQGRYVNTNDGEVGEDVDVIGTGSKRALVRILPQLGCGALLGLWELKPEGIVDLESGKVLLSSDLRLGNSWLVGAGQQGKCVVEQRIVAVSADAVEVERRGVCDGVPVAEAVISRWEVGRGRIRESFSTGGGRTFVERRDELRK